ncbi:MAG TPA: glycosyltransferase [Pyrinomonadaceae bacterium]|jgi:glycosyltransferase involved in cell wall biosynthesis
MSVSTLYLCYFGLREPLVQTQVLPYLRKLVEAGVRVSLLTFEPRLKESWAPGELEAERARLAAEGIGWHWRAYHKRPSLPATLYDVSVGARVAARLAARGEADVLHARGHVPALMAALAKRRRPRSRMLFDIRGFMPEEYTDAGVWPEGGALYRGVKSVERFLFASADAFVVLTEKAREILFPGRADSDAAGRPVEVIPCCVDFRRFRAADETPREELRRGLNLEGRRVVVYVGSFGGWYMAEETARFMALAHRRDPTTFALVLTQTPPEAIAARLGELGVPEDSYFVGKVAPAEVPRYLKASDVAVSFIRACYSKLSSSPTKIAEYLAAGLPVVCNSGVGDVDAVVEGDRVGVVLRDFDDAGFARALEQIEALEAEGGLRARCRASAESRFDIERVGGVRYRRLYERLAGARAPRGGENRTQRARAAAPSKGL